MKNKIALIALLIITLTSCNAIDKLTQFDIDYDETIVIPSSSFINIPFDVLTPDIESNSESKFEVNDTNKDLIEQIILKKLIINHIEPTNGDFGFLSDVEVFINAEDLPEIKIAWKNNIPDNVGKEIVLDLSGDDIQEYIKKDKFKLRLKSVTDETFNQDQKIEVHTTFFVDAKILGV